jgi:hypothetical protein
MDLLGGKMNCFKTGPNFFYWDDPYQNKIHVIDT